MKFHVSSEQQTFFKENLSIEFEQLLSPEEVEELNNLIEGIQRERLKCTHDALGKKSSRELFGVSGDFWRDEPSVQTLERKRVLLEIATQLFEQKPFRLGYDLYLPPYREEKFLDVNPYKEYIQNNLPFKDRSCIQGVIGGLLISLKGKKPGNVLFFSPESPLPLKNLDDSEAYLLVTYIKPNGIFIKNNQDPLFLPLKKLDYTIGDRIREETHPLICR